MGARVVLRRYVWMSVSESETRFVDIYRAIHPCDNESCLVLAFVAHWTNFTPDDDWGDWPLCLHCNNCPSEPAEWYAPLTPVSYILCASCTASITEKPYPSTLARHWVLREISQNRPATKNLAPNKVATYKTGMFDQAKAAFSVAQIAGEHTELRQVSPNKLKGCCPLHRERTPSFYVYTDTDTWRCFGACAEGGDVIALTQRLMDQGIAK